MRPLHILGNITKPSMDYRPWTMDKKTIDKKTMILKLLHTIPFLRKRYFTSWGPMWVGKKVAPFIDLLEKEARILDVGSGAGLVMRHLQEVGHEVVGLDIADQSYDASVKPVVYDGKRMPFGAEEFDVALLLTVLHHTEDPVAILRETARVAKQIVIIEDIYSNVVQQYLTYWMDAFVNWGYSPCPRTNKNDEGWRLVFEELGLEVKVVRYRRVLGIFRQAVYFLNCQQSL